MPVQFLWRERVHLVRAVLAHWVESTAWWKAYGAAGLFSGASGAPVPGTRSLPARTLFEDSEREVWRVEAASGASGTLGVYDLTLVPADARWLLSRVHD